MYQQSQSVRNILISIFNELCQSNKKTINLSKVQKYLDQNEKLKGEIYIFKEKISNYRRLNPKRQQLALQPFLEQFDRPLTDKSHLQHIFDSIDGDRSGKISKNELKALNNQFKLNLTDNDMHLMIEVCSRDGQTVMKEDLIKFLTN